MRQMRGIPLGQRTKDGSRFEYDIEKVADHAGYTIAEVNRYGVHYCLRFRRTPPCKPTSKELLVTRLRAHPEAGLVVYA